MIETIRNPYFFNSKINSLRNLNEVRTSITNFTGCLQGVDIFDSFLYKNVRKKHPETLYKNYILLMII